MALSNLMRVKIVLFISQKFRVKALKLYTKAKPLNLKRPWAKKDPKPRKLSRSKIAPMSFPGRVHIPPVKF